MPVFTSLTLRILLIIAVSLDCTAVPLNEGPIKRSTLSGAAAVIGAGT